MTFQPILRHFTVWAVRGVTDHEVKQIVRPSYPDDFKYQHEYQRIVWNGNAYTPAEALDKANASR